MQFLSTSAFAKYVQQRVAHIFFWSVYFHDNNGIRESFSSFIYLGHDPLSGKASHIAESTMLSKWGFMLSYAKDCRTTQIPGFVFVFKRWMTKWLFLFFLCVGNVWCQVTNACQGGKTTNATLIRTVRCSLPHPTQILSIQTQSKSIKFEDHHLCTFSANYCRLKSGLCHLFPLFGSIPEVR